MWHVQEKHHGKKRFIKYRSERGKCYKPLLSKHERENLLPWSVRKFVTVRKYLGVNTKVEMDYCSVYAMKCKDSEN